MTLYIGDNTMQFFYNIIIAMVISIVVSALITFLLSLIYEKKEEGATQQKDTAILQETIIKAPVKGGILPLSACHDAAFASGAMGKGVVIEPEDGLIVAPFDRCV